MDAGRADLPVSSDQRYTEGHGRRGDDTVRHVRDIGAGDLVDAVGDASIDRDDLDARLLGLTRLTNTLRGACADPVLLLQVDNLDDGDGGDEDGKACRDRTVERCPP